MAKKKVKKKEMSKRIKKLDAKIVQKDVDSTGVTVVAKLHAVKFGLACGIVSGLLIAVTTLAGIYGYFAECNALIVSMYGFVGYSVSHLGILLGAVYGFIDGFVLGGIFAWIYNKLI